MIKTIHAYIFKTLFFVLIFATGMNILLYLQNPLNGFIGGDAVPGYFLVLALTLIDGLYWSIEKLKERKNAI